MHRASGLSMPVRTALRAFLSTFSAFDDRVPIYTEPRQALFFWGSLTVSSWPQSHHWRRHCCQGRRLLFRALNFEN